jgi:hypothetical protein
MTSNRPAASAAAGRTLATAAAAAVARAKKSENANSRKRRTRRIKAQKAPNRVGTKLTDMPPEHKDGSEREPRESGDVKERQK